MQVPTWLGEQRRHMTGGALCLVIKDRLSTRGRFAVKTIRRLLWHWHRQLIELERGKFSGYLIVAVTLMTETGLRGDGILLLIVKTQIEEGALAVHFEIGNKSIPVGYVPPRTSPRVIIDAGQSKSSGIERGGRLTIRTKSFYTDDGVRFHQRERRRRIIEIDLALFYLLDQIGGQRFGIHF